MKKAIFDVVVAGNNISSALRPILLGLTITDAAGTHSDTATIDIDDSGGQIVLPTHGAAVSIRLGWEGSGAREVFRGTVDEVRSTGSKSGGRSLTICAKGMETLGKVKEGQDRHFDNETVESILKKAGAYAGISEIHVDPQLAAIRLPYIDMRGESFVHLGERLGALLGGNFRLQGERATMARRAAGYTPSVAAQEGVNLISWDITPVIGRARYRAAKARSYDIEAAKVVEETAETDIDDSDATITFRDIAADRSEAKQLAKSGAATSSESAGGGTVLIVGSTDAVPDGQCVLSGARPGIDGTYQIKSVTHQVDRSGGWTTGIELAQPKDGAGKDKRGKAKATTKVTGQSDAAKAIDKILSGGDQ